MKKSEALDYLAANEPSDKVSAVYDSDPVLGEALSVLMPGYEYPDIAHKTIAEILKEAQRDAQD